MVFDNMNYAIEVSNLAKCYQIYDKPSHRLKQMLLRGRHKYYKDFWALKNVNFKIKKGETVGIIGRNGSGKSTLLQMICGTLTPTMGEVKLNGRVAALLELGAGFNPEFTGVENVYMAASLYGLSKEDVGKRFNAITEFADIGDHIYQPAKTYSSGMYVRLAFAVIAHVDADILIIDEALAVGDVFFTQKCLRFLNKFKENNTLIFVSHDSSAVQALCDRAILLSNGGMDIYGEVVEVLEKYHASVLIKEPNKLNDISFPISKVAVDEINRIDISRNQKDSSAFITYANIFDSHGRCSGIYETGTKVELKMRITCNRKINGLLAGFTFKSRLGQVLFEDNISAKIRGADLILNEKETVEIIFDFELPLLRSGEYTFDLAVGEGTQDSHINLQWIYEALVIQCSSAHEVYGLFDVRCKDVQISFI
jgi:lipopolysaccharide transport system ATP-binding protein